MAITSRRRIRGVGEHHEVERIDNLIAAFFEQGISKETGCSVGMNRSMSEEGNVEISFGDYLFLIDEYLYLSNESYFIVKLQRIGFPSSKYVFRTIQEVATLIKTYLPQTEVYVDEQDDFKYIEEENYAIIRDYVNLSISKYIKQEGFERFLNSIGEDVSAYRGLDVIYGLFLYEEDVFDVRVLDCDEFKLSIYTREKINEKCCRADTIMQCAKQLIENYIA